MYIVNILNNKKKKDKILIFYISCLDRFELRFFSLSSNEPFSFQILDSNNYSIRKFS